MFEVWPGIGFNLR